METKEEILNQLNKYANKCNEGKEESEPILRFLQEYQGEEILDRKNFTGHITTSAFIINENADALLLLKHKSLNRWLQPGGHVDATDLSLKAAALREACEETGLASASLKLLSDDIFDIDTHHIPANTKKQEPAHVHHDIRFLFQCLTSEALDICLEESTDSKWIHLSNLKDSEDFYSVTEKIKIFISLYCKSII